MNKERKILLLILWFTFILSLCFISIFVFLDDRNVTNSRIKKYEDNIRKINKQPLSQEELDIKLTKLKNGVETIKNKFYVKDEITKAEFGLKLQKMITNAGLRITQYQTIEGCAAYGEGEATTTTGLTKIDDQTVEIALLQDHLPRGVTPDFTETQQFPEFFLFEGLQGGYFFHRFYDFTAVLIETGIDHNHVLPNSVYA